MSSFVKRYPYLVLGLVLLLVGGLVLLIPEPMSDTPALSDTTYEYADGMRFEISDTLVEREQGLSGRSVISDGYGMLFVFDEKETPSFWMKDMLVPIDIIWLSDDGVILGIEHSVAPTTYPTVFNPPEPIRLVLETRAGHARSVGWDIGTQVTLPNWE